MSKFTAELRYLAKKKGLTHERISKDLGIARQTVTRMLKDYQSFFNSAYKFELIKLLEVNLKTTFFVKKFKKNKKIKDVDFNIWLKGCLDGKIYASLSVEERESFLKKLIKHQKKELLPERFAEIIIRNGNFRKSTKKGSKKAFSKSKKK